MNTETCDFDIWEPPGYWHSHRCGRKIKVTIVSKQGTEHKVCGIHARMHERRPLSDSWFCTNERRD